ncbi:alpha-D-ribose 1-methylphosphonate 5-phosphate C-P-lyase PhnJ [Candidatus Chloroploca asiatica]|uniref:alpha-D-ribose 1-methylphosphonate 5-phosphate C-P-lyase PhnJ n=1 Tax=Candidatus Chloroploca asiatica TaxID=1506545 RepID=UPI000BEA3008|nr:alpha-D-ribose 1-methylphosphonate 5-phosphate C-P-lyase PhnJ [Candidatus Chloroploca asiatica]
MSLASLAHPRQDFSYGFLDAFAKRELRRRMLKAIAIPGFQVPYASRELPIARGWGTGGLQVTLSIVSPVDTLKVIDQGADDSVNAANLRRFIARMTGVATTTDTLAATVIQSRHRVPEERLREGQVLVLQVPDPEPLRQVQPDSSRAREMHADADYAQMWLTLYEQLVRFGRFMQGASYPVLVHGRYLMSPSPIPRWDTPALHQAAHLTLLSAGREKRLYAVPPYTDVRPIEFEDVFFQVENMAGRICMLTGARNKFMDELPVAEGGSQFRLSDTGYAAKLLRRARGDAATLGATYFDDEGHFYQPGVIRHLPNRNGLPEINPV